MDYKKTRNSTILMAIGYFFMVIALFSTLANVGLNNAIFLIFLLFPSYILLTIGISKIRKQNNLFYASYIIFLFIDGIFLVYLTISMMALYMKFSDTTIANLNITSKIIIALLKALVSVSSCLFANGLKEVFIKLGNKNMGTYSWIVGFSVGKLIILSVALPTVKITAISAVVITTLTIIVDFVIQISLLVYVIISSYYLNKGRNKKTPSKPASLEQH